MKIRYLGHASFELRFTAASKQEISILTDPFYYARTPGLKRKYDPIKADDVYDYILVSHEHNDHCDVQLIEELFSEHTKIITTPEAAAKIHNHPSITLNEGQEYSDENIHITAVHAEHKQSVNPIGFLLEIPEDIYFAGDTYLYQNIGNIRAPFIAFLPVGGNFTMNIDEATSAAGLVRPTHLIPMHYGTWEDIAADLEELKTKLKEKTVATKLHIMQPGETIDLSPFEGVEGQLSMPTP